MKNPEVKKILILGGEGFLGRNISEQLSKKFVCQSVGRQESFFSNGRKDIFVKADPYVQTIDNDNTVVINLIDNKVPLEVVLMLEKTMMDNLNIKSGGLFIFFSSAAVYFEPKSEYGLRKQVLESFYQKYCQQNNIRLIIFRLFNVYGPFQLPYRQGSLISTVIVNMLKHRKTIISNLDIKRDYVYTKDIAKVVEKAINSEFTGISNLATGHYTTISEVLRAIELVADSAIEFVVTNTVESAFCPKPEIKFGGDLLCTTLESGLVETVDFYKKNISKIPENYVGL